MYQLRSNLLRQNIYVILDYLKSISLDSSWIDSQLMQFDDYPSEVMDFIRCRRRSMDENFDYFVSRCLGQSLFIVLLGRRRHGKTGFMCRVAELYHAFGFKVCGYNLSDDMPDWFISLRFDKKDPYGNLPNDCLCLHDEIHLDVNAKDFTSDKNDKVRKYYSTSGHRRQTFIGTSQIASNISLDMMKYADVKVFKPMNRANDDIDRADYLRRFSLFYPEEKDHFLVDFDGELIFGRNDLPSFWSDKISEAYR